MSIFQRITLKTLRRNKTRTIVTIVGILLSLSMFTAVTTSAASFFGFMLESTIVRSGNWHINVFGMSSQEVSGLKSNSDIEASTYLQDVGYSFLKDCTNPDKPYLYVGGMDASAPDLMPIHLTGGRMPENEKEILLPDHLAANGGIQHKIGDTLELALGQRSCPDPDYTESVSFMGQNVGYLGSEEENAGIPDAFSESFKADMVRSYTVVGFYQRPDTESYSAPGYTALTLDDGSGSSTYTTFLRFSDPKDAIPWQEYNYPDTGISNYELLRFSASSYESRYNRVVYGLAGVLIIIIVFGSIALIYNAFSISVSERTQQFGLLASLGATKKQLIHSVLFEALMLCVIGIPLGVLAGLLGIGLTFQYVGGMVGTILYGSGDMMVPLRLQPSVPAILLAMGIGLITVLISAWLPARRAMRIAPIDAIRQTDDISFRPGRVHTSKLTLKFFGLPGMLASKNFKRNRKKYRATVLSLFVSVVLFISASSFCSYLTKSVGDVLTGVSYDIRYLYTDEAQTNSNLSQDELLLELSAASGITDGAWSYSQFNSLLLKEEQLSPDYLQHIKQTTPDYLVSDKEGNILNDSILYFINDSAYEKYLEECGLSISEYMNEASPKAVVLDFVRLYQSIDNSSKYFTFNILDHNTRDLRMAKINIPEGYDRYEMTTDEDGTTNYVFTKIDSDKSMTIPEEDCTTYVPLSIGSFQEKPPFFMGNDGYASMLCFLYPASFMEQILGPEDQNTSQYTTLYFSSDNHKESYKKMSEILSSLSLPDDTLYDYAESAESDRMLLTIINVFSYGFISLISLIAAANVFNTISTNISLRRREFAMLKSMGLTPKGFHTMMRYECMLYGFKGLLYGLPVSFVMTWFIYRSIANGLDISFYVPWHSVLIAVASVFVVVFATMLYSIQKVKKDNPVDALKNENL